MSSGTVRFCSETLLAGGHFSVHEPQLVFDLVGVLCEPGWGHSCLHGKFAIMLRTRVSLKVPFCVFLCFMQKFDFEPALELTHA